MALHCPRCGFHAGKRSFVVTQVGLQCPRCRALVGRTMEVGYATPQTAMNYPQGVANLNTVFVAGKVSQNPDDYLTATFLGLVTFEDVGNEKRSIAPYVEETQLKVVLYQKNIPPLLVGEWKTFYSEWKDFYSSPTVVPPIAYKKALEFRFRLSALQKEIQRYVPDNDGLSGVPLPQMAPPGAATAYSGGQVPVVANAIKDTLESWSTTAKVGLVIGGGLLAWLIYLQARNAAEVSRSLVPEIGKLLPSLA